MKHYPPKPHTDDNFNESPTNNQDYDTDVPLTPTDTTTTIEDEPVIAPIIPEIETPEQVEQLSTSFNQFAHLSTKRLSILIAIGQDLVSEKPRSDAQIAKELGVTRHLVGNCRTDPDFASCLAMLVVGIARGRADLYLRWTEKAAQEGKVSALKLLWEISGIYIQRTKNMNVNIDMSSHATETPQGYSDAVDEFLIALGESGWSSQQVATRMNDLRAAGAW